MSEMYVKLYGTEYEVYQDLASFILTNFPNKHQLFLQHFRNVPSFPVSHSTADVSSFELPLDGPLRRLHIGLRRKSDSDWFGVKVILRLELPETFERPTHLPEILPADDVQACFANPLTLDSLLPRHTRARI